MIGGYYRREDTEFALACSPDVILRLLDEIERLRVGLEEISLALPCDKPCSPRPGCDSCGSPPNANWCAGCVARKALERGDR